MAHQLIVGVSLLDLI